MKTMQYLYEHIGDKAFRGFSAKNPSKGYTKIINPVILDAVCSATMFMLEKGLCLPEGNLSGQHLELIGNEDFKQAISLRTTDVDSSIKKRIAIATKILFGAIYD